MLNLLVEFSKLNMVQNGSDGKFWIFFYCQRSKEVENGDYQAKDRRGSDGERNKAAHNHQEQEAGREICDASVKSDPSEVSELFTHALIVSPGSISHRGNAISTTRAPSRISAKRQAHRQQRQSRGDRTNLAQTDG
jgi:hypothetical protein